MRTIDFCWASDGAGRPEPPTKAFAVAVRVLLPEAIFSIDSQKNVRAWRREGTELPGGNAGDFPGSPRSKPERLAGRNAAGTRRSNIRSALQLSLDSVYWLMDCRQAVRQLTDSY